MDLRLGLHRAAFPLGEDGISLKQVRVYSTSTVRRTLYSFMMLPVGNLFRDIAKCDQVNFHARARSNPKVEGAKLDIAHLSICTVWGDNFLKGFVIHFLKVPLACSGSLAAAVQINGLKNSKENILHNLLDELLPQNVIVILNREEHSGAFFAGSV